MTDKAELWRCWDITCLTLNSHESICVNCGNPKGYMDIEIEALIDKRAEKRVAEARLGMIEYYDQVTNNKDMNWKGLFADNRKSIEYELEQLNKQTGDSDE